MTLQLTFSSRSLAERHAAILLPGVDVGRYFDEHPGVGSGAPLFMDGLVPAPFWFEFGLYLARNWDDPTRRQYAYTALTFARFIAERGIDVAQTSEVDLADYRRARREGPDGISPTSWATDATVLRLIFDYCIAIGLIHSRPWIDVGRRNAVSQPIQRVAAFRGLTSLEWAVFRDVGLKGRTPDGSADPNFPGKLVMRNVLGAQIALSTGMRLCEFHSLMTTEILAPPDESGGVHITLRACAKNKRERDVYLPAKVRAAAMLYAATERTIVVRKTQLASQFSRDELFVVDNEDPSGRWLEGVQRGVRKKFDIAGMPPEVRALTYREGPFLEPMAMFVNQFGAMASKSSWHRAFKSASARVASFGIASHASSDVQPHTLRHTFARRMLAFMNELRSSPDLDPGYGEIDPLVEVQRMLGHASLSTTAIYLRSNELSGEIEQAFADWNDDTLDYGTLVEQLLKDRAVVRG